MHFLELRKHRGLGKRDSSKFSAYQEKIPHILKKCLIASGSKGWRSGGSARIPLVWPRFKIPTSTASCGLSLLLVFSFAPRGFSPGTLDFPSPKKPTLPHSNSTRNQVDEEPLCGCATFKSLFIYLFIIDVK